MVMDELEGCYQLSGRAFDNLRDSGRRQLV